MAKPTLEEIFGAGATQTAETLVIQKSSLTGLTASASNSAESLLAAICLLAEQELSSANFDTNPDQSLYFESGFKRFVSRGENEYRVDQRTLNFARLDTSSVLDPDNY